MHTAVVILCVKYGDVLSFAWYLSFRLALSLSHDGAPPLFLCDVPAKRHFEGDGRSQSPQQLEIQRV